MKTTNNLLRGIFSLTLLCAIALFGCDNGGTTAPATYTVAFDGGDGSGSPPASRTVEENTSITLPSKGSSLTAPTGKEFDGWKTGGVTYNEGDSYTVTKDVTFIAQWKTVAPTTFTVTFNSDGGTAVSPKTVNAGGTVDALPTAPTKKDYIFDGWYTLQNGRGDRFTETTTVNDNITVYANWNTAAPTTHIVTFNNDGGTTPAVPATKTVNHGGTVDALPTAPTKTGYDFDGWYTLQNGGGSAFTATTTVNDNITVYAKWNAALTGAWVNNGTNPNRLEIFSADFHYRVDGSNKANALKQEKDLSRSGNTGQIYLSVKGQSDPYRFELSADGKELTVEKYKAANGATSAEDVTFTKILGSSTGMNGAWYTNKLLTNDSANTLLVIDSSNKVFTSFDCDDDNPGAAADSDPGNWSRWAYKIGPNGNTIQWSNAQTLNNFFAYPSPGNYNRLQVNWNGNATPVDYVRLTFD
jgi:uncharacterized repeat protein (TIGR02543 family)